MGRNVSCDCWYLAKELSVDNESEVSSTLYVFLLSSCLDPAIKVLLVIKVPVESSALDNVTCLSPAVNGPVISLGSLLLHDNYMYCSLS